MTSAKEHDDRPIGVFDSGIGGLTVMSELTRQLPRESIVYLGDTARVPYGDKSSDTIIRYALEDASFLEKCNVKLIIAACNTVSAVALGELKKKISVPVCGVIEAGAASASGIRGTVAVIGTKTTISSGAYWQEIKRISPYTDVECIACPLLVPLAEEGIKSWNILGGVFDIYLGKYLANMPQALLLGCTHYPLFTEEFDRFFSGKVKIISSASAAAEYVKKLINSGDVLANSGRKTPEYRFCVTDTTEKFLSSASRFFGDRISSAEQVTITNSEQL
ncbi:MAG: glutamate racemase [Lentisphaerae bacterium]|nr:glutamate racemase [Lentisphaerota bacterium]